MSSAYDPKRPGASIRTPGTDKSRSLAQSDISRTLPRQMSTGTLRGTQNVGYGNVKIDSSNNRIVLADNITGSQIVIGDQNTTDATDQSFGFSITDSTGTTMLLGIQSDGTLGFRFIDSDGFVLFDSNGLRWNWNDKTYETNQVAIGKLPDDSYNIVVAATGENVDDAF
jgi:hypothetical protein